MVVMEGLEPSKVELLRLYAMPFATNPRVQKGWDRLLNNFQGCRTTGQKGGEIPCVAIAYPKFYTRIYIANYAYVTILLR